MYNNNNINVVDENYFSIKYGFEQFPNLFYRIWPLTTFPGQ